MRHFSHDSHRGAERACAKRVGFVESRSGAAVGKGFEWARLPQVTIGEEILRAAPMTMLRREFEHDGMTLSYLDSGRNKDGDGKRVVVVGKEEAVADDVTAQQGIGFEDAADPNPRAPGLREFDRDRRAHRKVVGVGGRGVDEQIAGRQRACAGTGVHP